MTRGKSAQATRSNKKKSVHKGTTTESEHSSDAYEEKITVSGQIIYPKELLKMVEYNMYNCGKRPMCMTYHHACNTPVFYDTREEVNSVMKSLKAYRKAGQIACDQKHLYKQLINKRPVYCITFQQTPIGARAWYANEWYDVLVFQ